MQVADIKMVKDTINAMDMKAIMVISIIRVANAINGIMAIGIIIVETTNNKSGLL